MSLHILAETTAFHEICTSKDAAVAQDASPSALGKASSGTLPSHLAQSLAELRGPHLPMAQ